MIDYRMSMNHEIYICEMYYRITNSTREEADVLIEQREPGYNRTQLCGSFKYRFSAPEMAKSDIA